MIIYKDLFTGDELFSDIYKIRVINDVLYEVEGKFITQTSEALNDSAFGFNASAEGGDEQGGDQADSVSGCNIVLANRLVETTFKQKDYQKHIKKYVARVVGHLETTNPARIPKFKENATERVKFILGDFSEWQFFWGESMNEDGMTALMYFKDGVTPCMLFWKDGVVEEKV